MKKGRRNCRSKGVEDARRSQLKNQLNRAHTCSETLWLCFVALSTVGESVSLTLSTSPGTIFLLLACLTQACQESFWLDLLPLVILCSVYPWESYSFLKKQRSSGSGGVGGRGTGRRRGRGNFRQNILYNTLGKHSMKYNTISNAILGVFTSFMYVCTYIHMCALMPQCVCLDQRTTCRSQSFLSTMWIPEIDSDHQT